MHEFGYALIGLLPVLIGFGFAFLLTSRKPKHRHGPWEVVGVSYQPGRAAGSIETWGPDSDRMYREAVYGVTTLTQRCTGCQWVTTTTEVGRVVVDVKFDPEKAVL